MKKLILGIGILMALVSCDNHNSHERVIVQQPPKIVVTPQATNLGDNLDLTALGELVRSSSTAEEIESKLNASGSINNLDLEGDGSVDYIKVTEYGDGNQRGFSFTVDLSNGEQQEVATVDLDKTSSDVAMNIHGNTQIYGNNAHYQSHFDLGDLLIMHYLFSYHRPYYSPWGYGHYPSYYHSYRVAPVSSYRSRVSTTTKTTKITRTTTTHVSKSPNKNLSSKQVTNRGKSMSNPTTSQKSFTKTSPTASKPKTSGFGSNKTSTASNTSRPSSTSYSKPKSSTSYSRPKSSTSSFGSSSRRSSGSLFGSSSRRSSGFGGGGSRRRSDERFKTDIQLMSTPLDDLSKIKSYTYYYDSIKFPNEEFTSKYQFGFLAQQIETVYPNLVYTRTDGYKAVDYESLIPVLVEAVKELNQKVIIQDSIIKSLNKID